MSTDQPAPDDPEQSTVAPSGVDWLPASTGTVWGGLITVLAVVLAALSLRDAGTSYSRIGLAAALFLLVVAWCVFFRPRIGTTTDDLVLRQMVSTESVPLAAIESVKVTQLLYVEAGDRRWTSAAAGRSRRGGRQPAEPGRETAHGIHDEAAFVEHRLEHRVSEARHRVGVRRYSEEAAVLAAAARRQWSWPEIIALVLTVTALLVTVVLR